MIPVRKPALLFTGLLAIVALSGCERIQQAADSAVEQARQTTMQAIDEASQAGSIDEARQTAVDALQQFRQQASGLLDEASGYLQPETPPQQDGESATSEI